MNIANTLQVHSISSEATEEIGQKIGQVLKGGEVIELISDLGGGKTTLTHGIVKGMGSTDRVASPTFTLNKEYKAGNLKIVHYDFYRLHEPGILEYELAESLNDPHAVTIIEWADIVRNVLPKNRISINISSVSDNERELNFTVSSELQHIIKKLQSS